MTINKFSEKSSNTVSTTLPHDCTIRSCPGCAGILPIQEKTQLMKFFLTTTALIPDTLYSLINAFPARFSAWVLVSFGQALPRLLQTWGSWVGHAKSWHPGSRMVSACGSGTSAPFPGLRCGWLKKHEVQLRGDCGPLLSLADCATIVRWFVGSWETPTRNFCHIRHCRLFWYICHYHQKEDLKSQSRRRNNCCQTGVSINAFHLLCFPSTVHPSTI